MKVISTRTHGVLDYLTGVALLALPRLMGWSSQTTLLLTCLAIGTVVYSSLTRYQLGAMKVLPMKSHLVLDFMSGVLLCAAPFFLNESGTARIVLIGLGVFEILASLVTQPRSALEEDTAFRGASDLPQRPHSAR